uniref:potassium/sodium hyperpolarization-activated cyclic nucleotide-gated channel 2-like isoform X1 n=1 Tax=Styela clava TaxID=7725 RepID=UPI001939AF0B|nr:potassium/sodium hyperpolarization-activated cyclic nucleotide-gated channel 2-like isoform X1 [Styela clava]
MSLTANVGMRSDTSNVDKEVRSQKSLPFAKIFDLPRRSIGTLKERLKLGRAARGLKKRMSRSDTTIIAPKATISARLKSVVSVQSAKIMVEKITPTTNKVPITKWSRKLYGSDKAVMHEHERLMKAGFVIHPFSNFRLTWDVLSAILILANIVIIPMDIAFSTAEEDIRSVVFKLISDMWFMADIILNFRTGIKTDGGDKTTVELEPRKIAKLYIRRWFFIDLIASLPFDFIVRLFLDTKRSKAVRFLRIGKAVALVKVARVPRLIRGIHHWEEIFNLQYDFAVSMMRFAYLVFFIFMTCHINGCLQYMVPMFYDFPEDTWVRMRGLDHPNVTWWEAYSWSLFKSTSQMLCLGYSQIIPVGMVDLWMTMLSQITGAIIFAIFIGNAINLMEEMDASKNAFKMKINQIQEYLGFRRIPIKLRRKVLDYCEMRFQGKLFDEHQILKELSPSLRREVVWYNTSVLIQSVPLFEEVSDEFVYELGYVLKYSVYMPQDKIVKEGTKALHMFFISRGEVEIRSSTFVNYLSDGGHFGESCLFSSEMRRSADVTALTTVHIYMLHRCDYVKVLARFPDEADRIRNFSRRIRDISSRYDFIRNHNF